VCEYGSTSETLSSTSTLGSAVLHAKTYLELLNQEENTRGIGGFSANQIERLSRTLVNGLPRRGRGK
jgi:hypothetical protein